MPPPRARPGDTTSPRVVPETEDDDEESLAPTSEREQFQTPIDDTAPSNPALRADALIGQTVNGFHIEGVIGRGAAGIVYQAHQHSTGKKRALKVLKPEFAEDPEYIRRLIEEAKALSALRHRGIIDIVDFGALPTKQPYLVMELCDGLSLEDQLKFGGKPTVRETMGLLDELLSALIVAHGNGVVHRDLKPSNLFLATLEGGERALKVLDFGLARVAERKRSPTKPGTILGTPDYMAPEQIKAGDVDEQADVYAAGSIAFRLLTDRLPFIGKTGFMVIRMKLEQPTPHMRDVDPKIPPALDMLVYEMMAVDPVKRPTVRQAKSRFGAYLDKLNQGPTVSLQDFDDSSRPTTFHQFDDRAAAKLVDATVLGMPPPKFSPPSRPTEIERAPLRGDGTEIEPAHTDQQQFEQQLRSANRLRLVGVALLFGGLGAVIAWLAGR